MSHSIFGCQNVRNIKLKILIFVIHSGPERFAPDGNALVGVYFTNTKTQASIKYRRFNLREHIHKLPHKNEFTLFILHRSVDEATVDSLSLSHKFGSSANRLAVLWFYLSAIFLLLICVYVSLNRNDWTVNCVECLFYLSQIANKIRQAIVNKTSALAI